MQSPRILVIIPARGGSKGVPRKNVRLLNDKPLITYTIEAALQANIVGTRVIVSTEDEEIARIAKEAGAEIPFMRPSSLAQDDTTTVDVVEDVVNKLKESDYLPDYIMLLQPTSPFRDAADIEKAMTTMIEKSCDAVVSVTEVREHPLLMYSMSKEGALYPYEENPEKVTRRQDFPLLYRINGAIYIVTRKAWEQHGSFLHIPNIYPYVMAVEKSIDIDEEIDWKLAELYIQEQQVK